MIALQIGANKGYDDFTDTIKDELIEKLILVEPFNEHNESLNNCYSHIEKKYIENVIVTNNPDNHTETIFFHEDDTTHSNKFELASLNKYHSLKIRENYNESGIKERKLPSITINQLLYKYNVKILDLLFIDTEGFDDELIKSIDLINFKIKKIYYENLHINSDELRIFLESKNYKITKGVGYGGWSDYAELKID